MTVAELIAALLKLPQDAKVCIDRGGITNVAASVEYYPPTKSFPTGVVFVSDEE